MTIFKNDQGNNLLRMKYFSIAQILGNEKLIIQQTLETHLCLEKNLPTRSIAKSIPVILPSFPIEFLGKSVQGFMNYDRTNKQTENSILCITSLETQLRL